MPKFLISLDELDRVKRMNNLQTIRDLEEKTNVSRNTWGRAIKTRKPSEAVLQALAALGARPSHILVVEAMGHADHAAA